MINPCVYILLLENDQYYIGSSIDFDRRWQQHLRCDHSGTKYSKPVKVMLLQEFHDYSTARKIESRLKKFKSRKILEKIIASGKIDISCLGM